MYVTLQNFTPDLQKHYTDISAISVTFRNSGLKQLDVVDIEGNRVEDFDGATLKKMTDLNTKNLFDIQIQIRKRSPKEVLKTLQVQERGKFVLGYKDPISEPHCVYVKELAYIV